MNGPNWKDLQPGLFHPHTGHRFTLGDRYTDGRWDEIVGPRSRHLTIVQVCIDPTDGETLFINAGGLVVPCSPGRDLLKHLRWAEVEAYSTIPGAGHYAKKPHELEAMKKAGTLQRWVLYRLKLRDGAFFHDQQKEWADYLRQQAADAAQDAWAAGASDALRQRTRLRHEESGGSLWAIPSCEGSHAHQQECIQQAEAWAADLKARHLLALRQDAELAAWLRGEWPAPPLLKAAA